MKKIWLFALMGVLIVGNFTSCKKEKITPTVPTDMFCITAKNNNVQVTMEIEMPDQPYAQVSLLYSLDGKNWNDFIVGQTVVTLANAGDKMYMKANTVNTTFSKELSDNISNIIFFRFSQSAAVGGNILYLLNGEDPDKAEMGVYAFLGLFLDCYNLVDASSLILPTKLSEGCFDSMFMECSNLMKAPALPATKLTYACYYAMFFDCPSLQEAPELPATELADYCYAQMFGYCTSLQVAPELPATTIAYNCYGYMFLECTSLRATSELSALMAEEYSYYGMFEGCTSLTYVAPIRATQVKNGSFGGMFMNCTSLVNGPTLLASSLAENVYEEMFSGCTSLTNVTCKAVDMSAEDCLSEWMEGVTTTGVLHAVPGTDWTGKIPNSWTVVYDN